MLCVIYRKHEWHSILHVVHIKFILMCANLSQSGMITEFEIIETMCDSYCYWLSQSIDSYSSRKVNVSIFYNIVLFHLCHKCKYFGGSKWTCPPVSNLEKLFVVCCSLQAFVHFCNGLYYHQQKGKPMPTMVLERT